MPELPPAFLERLEAIVPREKYPQVLTTFGQLQATTFRVNTLLGSDHHVCATLAKEGIEASPIGDIPHCYRVPDDQREALTAGPWQNRGLLYVQDAGSVMIANLVQANRGEEILDLAAAPGGKTLALAAAMHDCGRIAAVEAVKNRFFRLQRNIKIHQASVVQCFFKDGAKVGRQVPKRFDRVLLDAPCSSESRFSLLKPASFQYWSEKKINQMQRKQKQLLHSAISALKPGGRLIYSTCSFAPEENEAVIDRQLEIWKNALQVLPIELPTKDCQEGLTRWRKQTFDSRLKHARRLLPNGLRRGFFVCALAKNHLE